METYKQQTIPPASFVSMNADVSHCELITFNYIVAARFTKSRAQAPRANRLIVSREQPMDDQATASWTRKLGTNNDYIDALLKQLLDLKRQSDPAGDSATASGKDGRAFAALQTAGQLVEALAGWAVHHTLGLAQEGLSFVPLQPSGTKKHPEYRRLRTIVDDHRHEDTGSRLNADAQFSDPLRTRMALIALIRGNAGAWPATLQLSSIAALEGLSYGEQSEVFRSTKKGKKAGLRKMRSQLRAVGCVEYRYAQGIKKYIAQKKVADAYSVDIETVRSWEAQLRKALGTLEVSREIAFARNHASNDNETGASLYGEAALKEYGRRHPR